MKKLTLISLFLMVAIGTFAQTVTKQYLQANGDTLFAIAVTTPSTLNYATLNQATVVLTNGGLPATISPASLNQATMVQGTTTLSLVLHPKQTASVPVIGTGSTSTGTTTPTPVTSSPVIGGIASSAITLQSGKTYTGLTIDLKGASTVGIKGSGVSNVHITKCKILNTLNFGIDLNKCTNVTIDSCFFSNVGVGVYAENNSTGIKVNHNQFLDIRGIYSGTINQYFGHAVQFNTVSGGGNQINYNIVENIKNQTDTTYHPHDILNVYHSNGLPGDSIQVIGNWIRGGQLKKWPKTTDGACGIVIGDEFGSYQVARGNILVNPGAGGVANIPNKGTSLGIKMDHNIIYSIQTPVTGQAIGVLNSSLTDVGYNDVNWTNSNGGNTVNSSPYSQYWLSSSPTPLNWNTNKWADKTVNTSILPATIITWNK